jgi:hypothetical protein
MSKKRLVSYRCADVSTGHITKKDALLLEQAAARRSYNVAERSEERTGAPLIPVIARYAEGFFCFLAPDDTDFAEYLVACKTAGFSRAFIRLLCRARREGNYLLRLDADGNDAPGLQRFDW